MDFLKTLMLYMTMTFAASVQSAPTPEITPVPTATPVPAVVSTVLPDLQTSAPTDTPAPGATAAPVTPTPEPQVTITPNPNYKNLERGDRGDQVKALQEKLIELGYLTGEADGAYGNQTRRAVMRFQYYNGLQQDGVAGRQTQTMLYENPDVIANPEASTAAPATDTPAPDATISLSDESTTPEAEPTIVPPVEVRDTDAASATAEATEPDATEAPIASGLQALPDAKLVLNDAGEPLSCIRLEDGVNIQTAPRVYLSTEEEIYLSLSDLCAAVDGWSLTVNETTGDATIEGAGYVIFMGQDEAGVWDAMEADEPIELADGDVLEASGVLLIRTTWLETVMHAETIWDAEESTLMIQLPDKEVATALD